MARLFLTPVISQQSLFSLLFEVIKSVDNQIPDDVLINKDNTLYYGIRGMPEMFKLEYSEADLTALAEKIKGCNGQKYVFF